MGEVKEKRYPIIEVFGPTIQGEGVMCGHQTHFIRSGGCDYKCKMCDSMHAVDPEQVKKNRTMMTAHDILKSIQDLETMNGAKCPWVTLSGGNPAMWDYGQLVTLLKMNGYQTAVETQGSLFKDWMLRCELVTVSPKGPGMGEVTNWDEYEDFIEKLTTQYITPEICIKVVVFNDEDLEFAKKVWSYTPEYPLYLSLGNSWLPGSDVSGHDHVSNLLADYRRIADKLFKDPLLNRAIFLPQLHVLIWSNEQCK